MWLQGGVRVVTGWGARACLASRHARSRAYARSRSPAYCSGATFWLGAPDGRLLTCGCRGAVCRVVRCAVGLNAEGTPGPGTRAAPVTYVRRRASYPAPQARGKQAGTRAPQAHAHACGVVAARLGQRCQRRCARNPSRWDAMRPDRRAVVARRGQVGGTTAAARA